MLMAKLTEVEGIGPVNATKLKKAGVSSTDSLLSMEALRRVAKTWLPNPA
jgi:predicted flap endonuclease-1-like 5' DNA nuclease